MSGLNGVVNLSSLIDYVDNADVFYSLCGRPTDYPGANIDSKSAPGPTMISPPGRTPDGVCDEKLIVIVGEAKVKVGYKCIAIDIIVIDSL
jgi:hypothetical protein